MRTPLGYSLAANGLAGAGLMASNTNVAAGGGLGPMGGGGVGMDPSASNGDLSGVHRQDSLLLSHSDSGGFTTHKARRSVMK